MNPIRITYNAQGEPRSTFQLVRCNRASATYEVRISDEFAFRFCLPREAAARLTGTDEYPVALALYAALPEPH